MSTSLQRRAVVVVVVAVVVVVVVGGGVAEVLVGATVFRRAVC